MREIYLLRHGDYENPLHVLPTRLPGFPLSLLGREQINTVAAYLSGKRITAIYSSPILRTKQSARIVAQSLRVPLTYSKSLLELRSPVQGVDVSISKEMDRCGDTYHYPLHYLNGGETSEHLYRRMKRIVHRALNETRGNIVFVGHGDPLMVFSIREQGKPLDDTHTIRSYGHYIPKGGMMRLEYDKAILLKVERVNY